MVKEILTDPNPILRKKSRLVIDFNDLALKHVIRDLKDTLRASREALGLAAPQIGINLRIFALDIDEDVKIFINPEITHFSHKKSLKEEGCLSVPNQLEKIARASKVVMKYYDEKGKKHKIKAKNILAQAFQHEIDHLDGVLYVDKTKKII